MANENTPFVVLSSKKNGGDLLCSQTPSLCLENEIKKKVHNRNGRQYFPSNRNVSLKYRDV
jgi:hypothetical protein